MTTQILSQERLKTALDYNQHTGVFIWKVRGIEWFASNGNMKSSNTQFAGKIAGGKDKKGYIQIRLCGLFRKAHRLAWLYCYGEWPDGDIDHINHNTSDNRLCNLRVVSNRENHKNKRMSLKNKSGITGVRFDKNRNKWAVDIRFDGGVFKKRFNSFQKAVAVRKALEVFYGYHENHGK